ncbi:KTSC domain-containing protein [Nitrosomonas sp.]|uniref:KTSC domain-containing protein n=1 Tax=Nitrosomonas sp. TaxID=42353 RepID=UPI001D3A874A|nr:KTSC domain-containing protein [Nitrosomonas sp.]MCB1947370.1 KTSC domain-containing protein [Nitrosomonas sp.]
MEMIRVNSSAMRAVGYDPTTRRMRITFDQGDSYDFCGVPLHIYEGLMHASSKGIYYNDHIRDRFQCY